MLLLFMLLCFRVSNWLKFGGASESLAKFICSAFKIQIVMKEFDIFYDSQNNVYQVRTKRDALVFEFPDQEEEQIFQAILRLYDKSDMQSFNTIKRELAQYNQSKILDVVQELQKCNLLNSSNFSDCIPNDIPDSGLYSVWHGISAFLDKCKLCFVGHKQLGEHVVEKAKSFGYTSIEMIYTPNDSLDEEKIKEIAVKSDFVIMDATFWSPLLLSSFNTVMLELNKPWLYIDGMIDRIHYSVGPLLHGEETGCYECLVKRMDSNDYNRTYTESYCKYLTESKKFSKNKLCSEPIEDIIASIILLDINKYILGTGVPETWKNTLLFNTSNYSITKQYFLKNPLCDYCNPKLPYAFSPWMETITLKEK